jgi:hypothetical protein
MRIPSHVPKLVLAAAALVAALGAPASAGDDAAPSEILLCGGGAEQGQTCIVIEDSTGAEIRFDADPERLQSDPIAVPPLA